jgi:hypothetical protein
MRSKGRVAAAVVYSAAASEYCCRRVLFRCRLFHFRNLSQRLLQLRFFHSVCLLLLLLLLLLLCHCVCPASVSLR